jgi:hypothetical protein
MFQYANPPCQGNKYSFQAPPTTRIQEDDRMMLMITRDERGKKRGKEEKALQLVASRNEFWDGRVKLRLRSDRRVSRYVAVWADQEREKARSEVVQGC